MNMSDNRTFIPTKRSRSLYTPSLWLIYGLLAGPLLLLMVFNYIPALSALYHAFTEWDVGSESSWVGLKNFRTMLHDPVFRKSVVNLSKIGLFQLIVNLSVPFVMAELIYHIRSERWSYAMRVLVVTPMVVPGVVMFMIWRYIYSDAGILTELLYLIGHPEWVRGWLSDPDTALWAVAFVGFPFANGFNVLIYYAGLANIPTDVLEAADVDGLGPIGKILHIHVPLILQQFKLLLIVMVITVVNGFEAIMLMTDDGGPGYETIVPGLYMYQNGFTYQRMGYACAIGLVMLVFLLVFTITMNLLFRSEKFNPTEKKA